MKTNTLKIALFSSLVLLSQGQTVFAAITPEEIVELVNRERLEARLPNLERSSVLDQAAQGKADDMAAEQYFSHTSPDGVTPWDWFRKAKYEYRYAGENLAIHFRDAEAEQRAWMESKKHCENIMSQKYLEIGVAVREMEWKGKQTTIAVQMFGTKMADKGKVSINEKSSSECPKTYPSVLGASIPTDQSGMLISAAAGWIADAAIHWKIDTGRLLAMIFFGIAQAVGIIVVLILATRDQWVRKW